MQQKKMLTSQMNESSSDDVFKIPENTTDRVCKIQVSIPHTHNGVAKETSCMHVME